MIQIRNLSKSYRTPTGRHYVFKNLTLDIPPDVSVGLIGRNGAGKSTLLRILGGIDRPDCGSVNTDCSISWPVGLSNGFQGSMTGRENVKFVARLYAKKHELYEKVAFVENFAELGKHFDMPIKTYSSGMRSRLGFGLSMAFDFDYYLIDEITAVGDASFNSKGAKLIDEKRQSSQFLMVSHSMEEVRRFCDTALLVGRTGVSYFNDIEEAIAAYGKEENVQVV
ncbi:ABC transporter ATP-binding protein [Chromobacterium sp. IIBBL 290-4]|uniref:ABC transporter ATP-binding protein n=1 Tax=Chromobacterium sp. IIBBL 290-4 TaxID=2953890 RepID=UPI0020B6C4D6|nr:ABC transporter ATP-binding protein [Chromobacterium sp. IIBBL 290-4]UTH76255.1 ABC transporter ATP-binding protein [Chromobacterium sp. IIBBL 290-4]